MSSVGPGGRPRGTPRSFSELVAAAEPGPAQTTLLRILGLLDT